MYKQESSFFPQIVLQSDYEMISKEWDLAGCALPAYPWDAPKRGFNYVYLEYRDVRVYYAVEEGRLRKSDVMRLA